MTGLGIPPPPSVLVARDRVLGPTLDAVAAELERLGHPVARTAGPDLPSVTDAHVLVISSRSKVDRHLLERAKALHTIVFPTIGVNSVSLDEATARGVLVANGPTAENYHGMAEATVMAIAATRLNLARKQAALRRGNEEGVAGARLVRGSTIGLLGFGRIAQEVARRLEPWDVTVLAWTRSPEKRGHAGVSFVAMHELFERSDVLSIHLPLARETHQLVGSEAFSRMKRGTCIVNTSRGGIVDEAELAKALRSGAVATAAIDVFAVEPLAADHDLRAFDQVILTNHCIGHTEDLFASLVPVTIDNVSSALAGAVPRHACNPAVIPVWRRGTQ